MQDFSNENSTMCYADNEIIAFSVEFEDYAFMQFEKFRPENQVAAQLVNYTESDILVKFPIYQKGGRNVPMNLGDKIFRCKGDFSE